MEATEDVTADGVQGGDRGRGGDGRGGDYCDWGSGRQLMGRHDTAVIVDVFWVGTPGAPWAVPAEASGGFPYRPWLRAVTLHVSECLCVSLGQVCQ